MKYNQKGFAAVEAIVVMILVGALSVAGMYAWKLNATKTNLASKKAAQAHASDIPSDWTAYQNKDLGISFAYPQAWSFNEHSGGPSGTKKYYIGDLTSGDKTTTASIDLIRKKDSPIVYSTIEEWRANQLNARISNLTEVTSSYTAFSYVLDASGATSLVYEILDPSVNVDFMVFPTDSPLKTTVEQILSTVRLE